MEDQGFVNGKKEKVLELAIAQKVMSFAIRLFRV
jgi:hypothetical protein